MSPPMTAVASPPSIQTLSQLGWKSPSKTSVGGAESASSPGEVARAFASRKAPYGSNSSSSPSSSFTGADSIDSSTSATAIDPFHANGSPSTNGAAQQPDQEARTTKSGRTLWGTAKAEAAVATSNGRLSILLQNAGNPSVAAPPNGLQQAAPIFQSQNKMQQPPQMNGGRMGMPGQQNSEPPALLVLLPMNGTFERKQITVPYFPDILRIGRQTNAKTVPTPVNGYFDSKVLSRQHAEVWADRSGKIWIRDVKSSNGTFVNGVRLSPESRDSEPHELRENDMLELGIDIVSEDQKSIVHHKVSAKVEHAGIQANSSSVLDLNLGDIDPGAGGGLMGGMLPQGHNRGRNGSQGSMISNGSRMSVHNVNGNMNAMGVQRHMNAWLSPVSIEQVVKRLGNELKQARQQAQDLHRTGDYFNAVLNVPAGEEPPKPPASILPPPPPPPQTNGIASPKKLDPMSPFSQPPAPPPQQPLPEKPEGAQPYGLSPKMNLSPTKHAESSSQILALAEALDAARKELDSQGSKMRQLEVMLEQERHARETAERRARILLEQTKGSRDMQEFSSDDYNTNLNGDSAHLHETSAEFSDAASIKSTSSEDTLVPFESDTFDAAHDAAGQSALKERLALVMVEMDELKQQMEGYKRRAETAEDERGSLAEMVQRIRQEKQAERSPRRARSGERAGKKSGGAALLNGTAHGAASGAGALVAAAVAAAGVKGEHYDDEDGEEEDDDDFVPPPLDRSATVKPPLGPGTALRGSDAAGDGDSEAARQMQLLQTAVKSAFVLEDAGDGRIVQAAPYASILGVVLLGVGLMAYLNGWQKNGTVS